MSKQKRICYLKVGKKEKVIKMKDLKKNDKFRLEEPDGTKVKGIKYKKYFTVVCKNPNNVIFVK